MVAMARNQVIIDTIMDPNKNVNFSCKSLADSSSSEGNFDIPENVREIVESIQIYSTENIEKNIVVYQNIILTPQQHNNSTYDVGK